MGGGIDMPLTPFGRPKVTERPAGPAILRRVFGKELAEELPVDWREGAPARCELLPEGRSRIFLPVRYAVGTKKHRAMTLHEGGHALCHYLWSDRTPKVSVRNAEIAAWIPVAAFETPTGFLDGDGRMLEALRLLRDWGMALGVVGTMERIYRAEDSHGSH